MTSLHQQPPQSFQQPSEYLMNKHNCILRAHSCILKTICTASMERLLNTYPPIGHQPYPSSLLENTSATCENAVEPIREIRFEDSPPAAVEAVLRYIYLGQWPEVEPLCGYSVKDLMALATYLETESLQDHCVDIVLGRCRGYNSAGNVATANRGGWHSDDHHSHGDTCYSPENAGFHPYRSEVPEDARRADEGFD
ncbi:hypothetical protein EDD21DRAFT_400399 [Dissophora ornata]|nr:hypothetical protein EDD21DRAFT_400399 [Dissophora ornata]